MIGLTTSQAKKYQESYGLNVLPNTSRIIIRDLFFRQFKSILIIILIIATVISLAIGDYLDASLIFVIILLNATLGIWQEYKASKELEALRKLEVTTSRVMRDGQQVEIPSTELVPNDIVVLEAGDRIPADGIVVESFDISVNESVLTGESLPVIKSTHSNDNALFFGTTVAGGRARMKVTTTGIATRFGKIATTLEAVQEKPTPLEITLKNVGEKIGICAVIIALVIFIIQIMQGNPIFSVFFSSTALMVAAVPEGLPAIITTLLAIGVHRMYKKHTLVRRMSAIEGLGATDVICTDKTGTLTKNEMRVKEVVAEKAVYGDAMKASLICNSAHLVLKEDTNSYDVLGDTTEGALLFWAKESGIDIEDIRQNGKIIEEVPFNLKSRMMSVLWQEHTHKALFVKGAPEIVIPLCKIPEKKQMDLEKEYKRLASKGLRVLAVAQKKNASTITDTSLEFLALVGIADEPRKEAMDAIQKARTAGIRVVMITGDNELTAKTIAEEVGLLEKGDGILTGNQLDKLTEEELIAQLESIRVFARVIPEHKLKIVRAYQKSGKTVAVTGDGVNDALALKQAHIGVAMGKTGTDVAKETADIVIMDDNLSTVITAIEQGRLVYSNIIKVVKFLITGNLSETLTIITIVLLGYPTALLPVQILWINLVTDSLPALSLAADSASRNIMLTPPRKRSDTVLNMHTILFIFFFGILISAINVFLFLIFFNLYGLESARSAVFTGIVVSQMIFIFLIRRHHSLFSNKYLLVSVLFIVSIQALILFFPPLRSLLRL